MDIQCNDMWRNSRCVLLERSENTSLYKQVFTIGEMREDYLPPNSGLTDPLIPVRFDICPICKSQRVKLLSFNNIDQNYSEAVDAYLRGYAVNFDRYEIYALKCASCGKEFIIDWTGGFPKPLQFKGKLDLFYWEFIRGL